MIDRLIEEFLSYIRVERGLSVHTYSAYRSDLLKFFEFVSKSSKNWPPGSDEVVSFLQDQAISKKAATQARILAAIKAFLRYLFREKIVSKDISMLFETPTLWQELPSIFSAQEIERLLQQPDRATPDGIRDYAIIELLYGTGTRVSEICSLTLYDVSDCSIKVHGKGGKERIVPIARPALEAIDAYLVRVRPHIGSAEEKALFLGSLGRPLTRLMVWKIVKKYALQAGITKKVSPHTFRHTYASHLLDAGADPRIIQELLGHASISSTDRYTQLSMSQVREVFRAFHPRWQDSKNESQFKLPEEA